MMGEKKKHFKGTKDKIRGDFCEDQRKQLKIFEGKKKPRTRKPLLKERGCEKKTV